ncbi:MAG: motility protein A [Myxococcota bacterium]
MDVATLAGLVIGLALIVGSMALGGSLSSFFNVPGVLIVAGGTFAALFVKETLGNVLGAFKVMMHAFFNRSQPPDALIPVIVELATKARKEGLVSLDGEPIDDPFLARGVQLGVDGLSPDVICAILTSEVGALRTRHQRGKDIFKFLGATAPAMGMIGTLIGLVQMLKTISDPSAIGPAMAVALLTTLYGAILAFLIFNPIADKLANRSQEETARKMLAIAGVESILNGESSMMIRSKLESFLAPRERARLEGAKAA